MGGVRQSGARGAGGPRAGLPERTPRRERWGSEEEMLTNIWGLDHMLKLCLVLQSSAALEVICQAAHG